MLKKIKSFIFGLFRPKKGRKIRIGVQERIIKANLLKLGEKSVEDVMIPRLEIEAVSESATLKELAKFFSKHSRIPLYREDLDDVVKIVHVKDCLEQLIKDPEGKSVETLGLEPVFVPPSKNLLDMLFEMRVSKKHMAVVVDEYGGTCGLVTIEDILEEIVGEISDEHDSYNLEPMLSRMPSGKILIDARIEISAFEEELKLPSILSQDVEDHTMGGLIITLLGRLPQRNELIKHKGFCFEASKITPRSVQKIIVHTIPPRVELMRKGQSQDSDHSGRG